MKPTQPTTFLGLYWRFKGILFPALAVIALAVAATFWLTGGRAAQLDADAIQTTAQITAVEESWVSDSNVNNDAHRRDSIRRLDIDFVFEPQDGSPPVEGSTYALNRIDTPEPGDRIDIWYSASNPDVWELRRGHMASNMSAGRIIALVFGAFFAGIFLLMPWSEARAILRLRDTGRRREATVVAVPKHQIKHGYGDHLHWQIKGLNPQKSVLPVPEDQRPAPGETIIVYGNEDAALWEGEFGPPKAT